MRFGVAGSTFDLIRPLLIGVVGGVLAMFPPYSPACWWTRLSRRRPCNQLVQIAIILAVVALTTSAFDIVRN